MTELRLHNCFHLGGEQPVMRRKMKPDVAVAKGFILVFIGYLLDIRIALTVRWGIPPASE
ncbi:hypothetical protein M4R22_07665 [Acidovorax sp. GBBC 3334]|uniref:hypothetical protein n=1 Tax=Acidovorax sp. GBBC 3334 TaxID=2940496 RepID=UPI002303A79D|nr:hypothetical protein [Acidovorax sp. GBBC 3334]MDA8454636.1 hypothetical protein [Acidovorax sp. GBBC 3334]